jgi:DNA-binding Lrp family transcriptional regulator
VTETTGRVTDEVVAPENACPVAPVVDVVFSRWTTPILWVLHYRGPHRFVELQRSITTITPKVLTERLRQLERDGLITRNEVYFDRERAREAGFLVLQEVNHAPQSSGAELAVDRLLVRLLSSDIPVDLW